MKKLENIVKVVVPTAVLLGLSILAYRIYTLHSIDDLDENYLERVKKPEILKTSKGVPYRALV